MSNAPFSIEPEGPFSLAAAEAVGRAYDLGSPASAEDFDRISDGWRPYRTWVAVQMRSAGPG